MNYSVNVHLVNRDIVTAVMYCYTMHVSMLSPSWGGSQEYVGHLTSIAFPALGNLTMNLGPCLGFQGCSSVCSVAIKALKDGGLMEVSTCFS